MAGSDTRSASEEYGLRDSRKGAVLRNAAAIAPFALWIGLMAALPEIGAATASPTIRQFDAPQSDEAQTDEPDRSSVGAAISRGCVGVNEMSLPETVAPAGRFPNETDLEWSAASRTESVPAALSGIHASPAAQVVPPSVENSSPLTPCVTRTSMTSFV